MLSVAAECAFAIRHLQVNGTCYKYVGQLTVTANKSLVGYGLETKKTFTGEMQ